MNTKIQMLIKLIIKTTFSISLLFLSNAYCLANNNMDSYTFSNPNNTPEKPVNGTVFTLSTSGQSLNVCTITPSTTSGMNDGPVTYNPPNCLEGFGSPDSYQSVAFMGTTNNSKYNYFAVGTGGGVVDVYQLAFDGSGAFTNLPLVNSYNICFGYGNVESLTMDPDGVHLYVGCAQFIAGGGSVFNNTNKWSTGMFNLVVATLNTDGSLSWGNQVSGLFPGMKEGLTAGLWVQGTQTPVIFPTMRSYAPNSPQLKNTGHLTSGGVLVSGGLIGAIENTEASNATPVNVGIFCSQGNCEQAFSMALYDKNSFSVMTAAELGMDCGPCNSAVALQTYPALYWNQVAGGGKL